MKLHIIGISGKTSSAIATMFKGMGWDVSGSDQGVYPPASDYLIANNITIKTPYDPGNLDRDTNLVVVAGNALIVDPENPEYLKALDLEIPVKSFPEVLEEYVIKSRSIVVVGNYGKGTISGAIMHALTELQADPSYMIGGQVVGYNYSIATGKSDWSVVEGDEYPTPPLKNESAKSKFFYYHPKYLVLTSAEWDHYDKFPTEQAYVDNYIELVSQLPKDGLLVANLAGKNVETIISYAPCKVITYGAENADYYEDKIEFIPKHLFGNFNMQNLTAAHALLAELGFDHSKIKASLENYKGLEFRMQKVLENESLIVIRDLAHSPVKAEAALTAVRQKWPNHYIVGVFEAFSSSLKTRDILAELPGRFDSADEIIIPKVDQLARIEKDNRATGKEITESIGQKAEYIPKDELLLEHLLQIPKPAVVIFMSSGGIRSIPEKYLEKIHEELQHTLITSLRS